MDNFEEALLRLIDEWLRKGVPDSDIISVLELRVMALKEEDDE